MGWMATMNLSDHYRKLAIELAAVTRGKKDPAARIEWLHMADAYRRLAELADRNARLDLVYEPPIRFVAQQIQPRPEDKAKL